MTVSDLNGCDGQEQLYVDIANIPLSILVQIPTPYCLNSIAKFIMDPPPPIYPQILWTLNNPLDQIISGQGTDTIEVQWATIGQKLVKHQYGANGIQCSAISYSLNVVVCADANEPTLAAVVVSPNPFIDFIQIEFTLGLPGDTEAVLTDVSGKIVLEKTVNGASERLPTGNIHPGIYFLKIRCADGERVWKLAKQ